MMSKRWRWILGAVLAVVLVGGVAGGSWAVLRDDEAHTSGTSQSATYQLNVEPDDGWLELDFELTSSAPGETWHVKVTQNDDVLLDGDRMTDEDAELDVDLQVPDNGDEARFLVVATPEHGDPVTAQVTTN